MIIPGYPPDEERRLRSLKASGILGSAKDARFDRLTRMAKRLFDVPVALISLVDEDRLWLKSCDGMVLTEQIPRATSFSAHALLEPEPMIIRDTYRDVRFSDNPYVIGHPYVRFYSGCPILLPDGAAAGSFCLLDTQPRTFSEDDLLVLKDLAAMVEDEFAVMDAATADKLTGLLSPRGISALAQYSLVATQRRAEPLSLAYIYLGNIQNINNTWGYTQGDKALEAIAELMKSSFRGTDLISRQGGDAFVIILPDTSEQGAFIALQHLSERVEDYNFKSGNPWKLEFSVGIAEYNEHLHLTPEDLIKSADCQMSQMKLTRKEIAFK